MAKPTSYNADKLYRVMLSRSVELPAGSGRFINPAPIRMVDGRSVEQGSVRLRGDICTQINDAILDAYEAGEG